MPRKHNASIVRYTTAVLPSCKQFSECHVQSTVIKHTVESVAFLPQPVGSLPLAQNAWHCTSDRSLFIDRPKKVDRPPVKVERPKKVDRLPIKVDRPKKVDRLPIKVDRPTKVDRLPIKVSRPHREVDRPPTEVDRPPREVDRPRKVDRSPNLAYDF